MPSLLFHTTQPYRAIQILHSGLLANTSSTDPRRHGHDYPRRAAAERLRDNLIDAVGIERFGDAYPRREPSVYFYPKEPVYDHDYEDEKGATPPANIAVNPAELPDKTFFQITRDPIEDVFMRINDEFQAHETTDLSETSLSRADLEAEIREIVDENLGPWSGDVETFDVEVWCEGPIPPEKLHLPADFEGTETEW